MDFQKVETGKVTIATSDFNAMSKKVSSGYIEFFFYRLNFQVKGKYQFYIQALIQQVFIESLIR